MRATALALVVAGTVVLLPNVAAQTCATRSVVINRVALPAATLRALEVGQAFLMTRDGAARSVQFNPPKRTPSLKRVAAFRQLVLQGGNPDPTGAAVAPNTQPPDESVHGAPEDLL